jgi:hypothetical protein
LRQESLPGEKARRKPRFFSLWRGSVGRETGGMGGLGLGRSKTVQAGNFGVSLEWISIEFRLRVASATCCGVNLATGGFGVWVLCLALRPVSAGRYCRDSGSPFDQRAMLLDLGFPGS